MAASGKKKSKGSFPPPEPRGGGTGVVLPAWLTNRRLHVWSLFAFSVLVYANTLWNDYAQDDAIVIYDNMFTTQGLKGIPGILQYDTFYGFFKEEGKANLVAGGRYRPLSLVLFAIEVQFFGQRPWVGHLMNSLWFALTVVVLYLLLLRLLRLRFGEGLAFFVALASALLFAAHPIHAEAVANIKGRDEILSLLGSLSALYFALRAGLEKKKMLYLPAAVLFFLALLAKENAVTFVLIAPLSLYFFLPEKTEGRSWKIFGTFLSFSAAAVLFLIIRFSVLGFSLGQPPLELMNNPFLKIADGRWVPFSPGEKLATVMYTLGRYLQLLVFPHPLTHDYYPRHIYLMSWGDWRVLLSLVVHLGLGLYALTGLRRRDPVSYAILFYLITLSIVSNIVFPIGTNMAERLLFMPSVGFCLAIGLLAWRFAARGLPGRLVPVLAALGVAVLLFSAKTIGRNTVWKDNYTLFTTDIHTSPNSAKLRNAVGGELVTQSLKEQDETRRKAMLTQAAGHLEEAIRLHPTYKNAYLLLGNAYNYLQQYEQSIASYQKALQIDPGYADAQTNLGITYRDAGRYYGEQQGDLNKALQYLQQAYQMRPDEYETVRLLGVAYGISGNNGKAIELFAKGTELMPTDADAWFNLGTAYLNAGLQEQAQACFRKARELDPGILEKRRQG